MDVLILGGRPIGEPVAWMGPFVMNTREEVVQAFSDYQAGRLGSIPAVHGAPSRVVSTGASARVPPPDRPWAGPGLSSTPSHASEES